MAESPSTTRIPTDTTATQDRRPVDPATGQPLEPMAQPGYYPGFSTLAQQDYWDAATREVVLKRVNRVPPMRFFQGEDARLFQAIVDRIIPQDDRDDEHKIPVANYVDEAIHENRIPGFRYEDMPPMDEAHRLGLRAIDQIARHLFGHPFVDLGQTEQDFVLLTLADGKPPAAQDIWERLPVHHYWTTLVEQAAEAYYAHPYAWDEIGFGGPAYPRPYTRLERGEPEPWEVEEDRYEWAPPPGALSGGYKARSGTHPHRLTQGGGTGTH